MRYLVSFLVLIGLFGCGSLSPTRYDECALLVCGATVVEEISQTRLKITSVVNRLTPGAYLEEFAMLRGAEEALKAKKAGYRVVDSEQRTATNRYHPIAPMEVQILELTIDMGDSEATVLGAGKWFDAQQTYDLLAPKHISK